MKQGLRGSDMSSGSNKVKAWRHWSGSYFWTVVVGW